MVREYEKSITYESPDVATALAALKLIPKYWEGYGSIGSVYNLTERPEDYRKKKSAINVDIMEEDRGSITAFDFALPEDIFEMFFGKTPASISFDGCSVNSVRSSLIKAVLEYDCSFSLSVRDPDYIRDKRKKRVRGETSFCINSPLRENEVSLSWYSPEDGRSLSSLRKKFRKVGLKEARE